MASFSTRFRIEQRDFSHQQTEQLNKAFEMISNALDALTPTPPKGTATATSNGQVNLGGTESSGFFVPHDQPAVAPTTPATTTATKSSVITTAKTALMSSSAKAVSTAIAKPNLQAGAVNNSGGSPGNAPIGPSPASGTVQTDSSTISGNGQSQPLSLVVPVTIPDGGTGLVQATTQQITTNGTLIGAGTAQAQPALTLAGVTTKSSASWSLPNAPVATWQTGIMGLLVCTANTVTLWLMNPTAGAITPAAQLVNIKVIL